MIELWAEYGKLQHKREQITAQSQQMQRAYNAITDEMNQIWAQINQVKPEDNNDGINEGELNKDTDKS